MQYVLTVNLTHGSISITCRYPELVIMYMEAIYGDAVVGWDARGA